MNMKKDSTRPKTTFSPDPKKLKRYGSEPIDNCTSTDETIERETTRNKMAAPTSAKRLYATTVTDADPTSQQPPPWFQVFVDRIEDKIDSRLQAFADRFEDKVESLMEKLSGKITVNEEKIESLNFELENVKDKLNQLRKENETVLLKLDELENRSRRKNIVIFGLNEVEGPNSKEDCYKTVKDFFTFVGAERDDMLIERAHRTPTAPRPAAGKKPRMIHVGFATFVAKEKVRRLCIEKLKQCKGTYNDSKVYVAEDLSQRVVQMRKQKQAQWLQLKGEGKRPFFRFPDHLCYKDQASGRLITVPAVRPVGEPASSPALGLPRRSAWGPAPGLRPGMTRGSPTAPPPTPEPALETPAPRGPPQEPDKGPAPGPVPELSPMDTEASPNDS